MRTPKQRVLKKYPEANAYRWAGSRPWVIYADDKKTGTALNIGDKTAEQAWASAWERMRVKPADCKIWPQCSCILRGRIGIDCK